VARHPDPQRARLGVLRPPVENPTVAFTLPQVRALRVAAWTYRGRGPLVTRDLVRLRHASTVDLLTTTGIRADALCSADRVDLRRTGPDGRPALRIHGKGAKNRWVRITVEIAAGDGRGGFLGVPVELPSRQDENRSYLVAPGDERGRLAGTLRLPLPVVEWTGCRSAPPPCGSRIPRSWGRQFRKTGGYG
jgi:hypothetical protein